MNSLFEVTNGYTGGSYTRCYVWAADEASALTMAREAFRSHVAHGNRYPANFTERLEARELFSASAKPFCSEVSDDGWEFDYVPA